MSLIIAGTVAAIYGMVKKKKDKKNMSYLDSLNDSILGADEAGVKMRVKSANTAVYAMNLMTDTADADIGNGEPVILLQPGTVVEAVGAPTSNKAKVPYMPVRMGGADLFWIRASSLELAPVTAVVAKVDVKINPFLKNVPGINRPVWQVMVAGLGVVALGAGVYMLAKHSGSPSGRRYAPAGAR